MKSLLTVVSFMMAGSLSVRAALPEKIYGVNIGGWLLIEPWMMPTEWESMGGEICDDCSTCISSEFALAQAYPDTVEQRHENHWNTWFSEDDINTLADAGINFVRIPLGFWIVEDLVDRETEFYTKGGLPHLKQRVGQLRDAGIKVLLDHHALPGVATAGQEFAGNCTSNVQFYTPYNYHRALVWTAVMTAMSHYDPDFTSVVAIEAVNEPIMDAAQTPGYGNFTKNFVDVVRAVEIISGIHVPGFQFAQTLNVPVSSNFNDTITSLIGSQTFNPEVTAALAEAAPIIAKLGFITSPPSNTEALVTVFMDVNWQYDNPSNPADAANGPQAYDNHLYYSYGGVADPTEAAYMASMCSLSRIQNDAALGDSPLFFGEWSLATQFDATDDFIKMWGDAQKLQYSKGAGWIFWNHRVEADTQYISQWSYLEALEAGVFLKDPTALHDPNVCNDWTSYVSTSTSALASATSVLTTASTTAASTTVTTEVTSVSSAKSTGSIVSTMSSATAFTHPTASTYSTASLKTE